MSNFGIGKFARVGGVVFAAAVATASVLGGAAAKHIKHHHQQQTVNLQVQNAQASLDESSHLSTMRYYGGPKSPMWRSAQ
jgi:hypothetical protein